jgi:methionyl-tRNA formyltransferase
VTDPYPGAFTEIGGSRLMVWWAETDTPATRAGVGLASAAGEILSVAPLVVATGGGALELTKTEWRGAAPALQPGQRLA